MTEKLCPVCEGPLPAKRTKPHIFCSHRCRTKASELEGQIDSLVERLTKAQAQWQRVQTAKGHQRVAFIG
jgi:hypothetical protein